MKTTLICAITLLSVNAFAQNPLQPFESIIGGQWWLGEDSYQTFEWGVGNLSVRAEAYFMIDGQAIKGSEGKWFYHPGEQKIKGFFNAQNMPITFFDYTTVFDEQGNLINTFVGYGPMGNGLTFQESWIFTSTNSFTWTLSSVGENGSLTEMMKGEYSRVEE